MITERRSRIFATLLLAAATSGGCAWGPREGEMDTTPMHRRFTRTMDIQTGVILGNLDRAQAAAAWIAGQDGGEDFPGGTDQYRDAIRDVAALIAQDQDLQSVAVRTGQMALACGGCHLATGGGPHFVTGRDPDRGSSTGKQMIRHIWAADRMWEGLVGPSDDAWDAGSKVLGEEAESLEKAIQASGSPEEARAYLAEVRRLGREGQATSAQEARASIYGRLLATCNGCHRVVGVTGTP